MIDWFFLFAGILAIVILLLNLVFGRSLLQGHLDETRQGSPTKYWRTQVILITVAAISLAFVFLSISR